MREIRTAKLLPYLKAVFYSGRIRWILINEDKKPTYCAKCGNYANGVLVFHYAFNVPLCKSHFSDIYFKKHPEKKELMFPCKLHF